MYIRVWLYLLMHKTLYNISRGQVPPYPCLQAPIGAKDTDWRNFPSEWGLESRKTVRYLKLWQFCRDITSNFTVGRGDQGIKVDVTVFDVMLSIRLRGQWTFRAS